MIPETYATAAAAGITAALASLAERDLLTYADAVEHLAGFLADVEPGPAAEALAAGLRDLAEDHDHDIDQDWDDGTPLDSYAGAVAYLTYYRDQVASGYYDRALLVGEAA